MATVTVLARKGGHLTRNIRISLVLILLFRLALPVSAGDKEKDEETFKDAAIVLEEMLTSKNLPPDVIARAYCMIVLPRVKKFAVGLGATGGRGPLVCRTGDTFNGNWSAPAMYSVGGFSAGFQLGGSSTDLVLLVMNEKGVNAVLKGKTKLGTDATATAGPVGTTAASISGNEILSYGNSNGLFAGVSLGGASIEPDEDANHRLYGKAISAKDIVTSVEVTPPSGSESLISLLDADVAKRSN